MPPINARLVTRQSLLPEEEEIGDPDDDGEIDVLLPADLWFLSAAGRNHHRRGPLATRRAAHRAPPDRRRA